MHAFLRELLDPDGLNQISLVGGVQHTVHTARQQDAEEYVQDHLETDCSDGQRARLVRLARNQVSREANSEVAPVGLAPVVGAEVLERVRPLELGLAALFAGRDETPHSCGEEADVVRRETLSVGAGSELHQGWEEANPLEEVRGVPDRHERDDPRSPGCPRCSRRSEAHGHQVFETGPSSVWISSIVAMTCR